MKKLLLIVFCAICLATLSACGTINYVNNANIGENKLPETENIVFSEVASEYMEKQVTANLYFAYKNQNLLVAETRDIKVKSDEIPELSIIRELLYGPQKSNGDLVNLFPQELNVLNAVPLNDNKILAITFSEEFLNVNYNANDKATRQLVLDSIAATITDNYPYLGIQIFIKPDNENSNAYRLKSSFLFDDKNETLPPIIRNDSSILTPRKSADKLVKAWINMDVNECILYLGKNTRNQDSLSVNSLRDLLTQINSPMEFDLSQGTISPMGNKAVVILTLYFDGNTDAIVYPLQMLNINGIWKVDENSFLTLISYLSEGAV